MHTSLNNNSISLAVSSEQIRACFPIMHQLRPHLVNEDEFVKQVERQIKDGYLLAYLHEGSTVKALAGFRFLEFLAWGKVVYIDDLVTNSNYKKNGYGRLLLEWVIQQAIEAGCDQVHLDSGPQRHDAHRLYLNAGFKIIGHHFAMILAD